MVGLYVVRHSFKNAIIQHRWFSTKRILGTVSVMYTQATRRKKQARLFPICRDRRHKARKRPKSFVCTAGGELELYGLAGTRYNLYDTTLGDNTQRIVAFVQRRGNTEHSNAKRRDTPFTSTPHRDDLRYALVNERRAQADVDEPSRRDRRALNHWTRGKSSEDGICCSRGIRRGPCRSLGVWEKPKEEVVTYVGAPITRT